MKKISCKTCGYNFHTSRKEFDYLNKHNIPVNGDCFYCKWQQLLAFWPSIGRWHKRKCDFSGENIITNYPGNARFPVYKSEYFFSDKWNIISKDIEFDRSFFEQLKELQEKNPRPHMLGTNNENCNYCDDTRGSKNCFLSSSQLDSENLFYSYRNLRGNNCTDLVFCFDCDLCSSLVYSSNCYKLRYSYLCKNTSNSYFLYDCINCDECLMCWNLRDKKNCILNIQYSEEEYNNKIKELDFGSRKEIEKLEKIFLKNIREEAIHPDKIEINSENSTGNFLNGVKDLSNCFLVDDSEACIDSLRASGSNNSINICSVYKGDRSYMSAICAEIYDCKFCSYCVKCKNCEYLDNCTNCENCFACVGLKDKKNCILNKQYNVQEYKKLVKKIKQKMKDIGEYGQFFPYNMMYTDYNTSMSRLYFPKTKNQILGIGGYWEEEKKASGEFDNYNLPDNIKDININTTKAIKCEKTGDIFNYLDKAIDIHKKLNIPLKPITHLERIQALFKPLCYITPFSGKSYLSGKDLTHYYPKSLGYKKVLTKEEYLKEIY